MTTNQTLTVPSIHNPIRTRAADERSHRPTFWFAAVVLTGAAVGAGVYFATSETTRSPASIWPNDSSVPAVMPAPPSATDANRGVTRADHYDVSGTSTP